MGQRLHTLFVYGTLKRGEINHALLAPYARVIVPAQIRGLLYDTGDFPALIEGEGRVYGELVFLDPDRLEQVIDATDRLEGCVPGRDDLSLYHRRVVTAVTEDGEPHETYVYFYNAAHPTMPPPASLTPVESGIWTAPGERAPSTTLEQFEQYRTWVQEFSAGKQP
jgi:gamma-glutamylcyclotransferase (GGCT)/AIG2-like uncharacterized protein YtfP